MMSFVGCQRSDEAGGQWDAWTVTGAPNKPALRLSTDAAGTAGRIATVASAPWRLGDDEFFQ
jgi:hypothetical protein